MRVLAVVSQKGGSGKTTLSGHIAVQATLAGDGPVAIIDTDPQGSLAAWWNERRAEQPLFVKTTLPELRGHLDELRRAGVRMVVIDTPPAITMAIQEVIEVADYVVVPTRPSPHDLRAVGATVRLVERVNKPLVFVVNDATPRARITSEAAIALSQHGTVAPVTIHHRTDFAASMIDGRTVMELKAEARSSLEIKGLWEYLHARLQRQVSTAAFHAHTQTHGHYGAAWTAPRQPVEPPSTPATAPVTAQATPPAETESRPQAREPEEVQVLPFDALVNETERRYMAPTLAANNPAAATEAERPVLHKEVDMEARRPEPERVTETNPYQGHHRGFGRRHHVS